MRIKEFWNEFYGHNLFRDTVYARNNYAEVLKFQDELLRNEEYRKRAYAFLLKHGRGNNKGRATLMSSHTLFKDINAFRKHDEKDRLVDRLFFDFDIDKNEDVIRCKKNFDKAFEFKGKDRINLIAETQKEFRNLVVNTDLLDGAYKDLVKLYDYYQEQGLKPLLVASGSKGFHLTIFFKPVRLNYVSELTKKLAINLKKKLDLKTLDLAPYNRYLTGKGRVPYSQHDNTLLYTTPFDIDEDLKTVFKRAKMPKIMDFYFKDYSDNSYDKFLLEKDLEYDKINSIKKENQELEDKKNKKKYSNFKEFSNTTKIRIAEPEDVLRLNKFPCFNNMNWSDTNNYYFVMVLAYTDLPTMEAIQEAMIIFWKSKGRTMQKSDKGLKRVTKTVKKTLAKNKVVTKNGMLNTVGSCKECEFYSECFRCKVKFKPEYDMAISKARPG